MSKIIGNTTATPNPRPDWAQTDETKADYIKNKPNVPSIVGLATETYVDAYVDTKLARLIDSAPETLNTLNELADALGDDPNFATTMVTELGKKADKVDMVGQKTEDSGEIFNDYANNTAYSIHSIATGADTMAGGKGFKILNQHAQEGSSIEGTGVYYLDSVAGIEPGMSYSVQLKGGKFNAGTIEGVKDDSILVNGYTEISPYTEEEIAELKETSEHPEYITVNYLTIVGRPDLGTIDIGFGASSSGINTIAHEIASHTEGSGTKTIGKYAHAEGHRTTAAHSAHSEGIDTKAMGSPSHAEGRETIASGGYGSHAEGYRTEASGISAHAEGRDVHATGNYTHVEGYLSTASGKYAHAENYNTTASGDGAHAEGSITTASGEAAHAEGKETIASGVVAHSEGYKTKAIGLYTHAEGAESIADKDVAHAEGYQTQALGKYSHAEGRGTIASGQDGAHAEGYKTEANGNGSHAEGAQSKANGIVAHAEGNETTASGNYSHSEGNRTIASGNDGAHAEGYKTTASGSGSHAEGANTIASGIESHAEGVGTVAAGRRQHVQGRYNIQDGSNPNSEGDYAHIVGNGTGDGDRKNAHTLDWKGNAWFAGNVTVGDNKTELLTKDLSNIDDTALQNKITELGIGGSDDNSTGLKVFNSSYTVTDSEAVLEFPVNCGYDITPKSMTIWSEDTSEMYVVNFAPSFVDEKSSYNLVQRMGMYCSSTGTQLTTDIKIGWFPGGIWFSTTADKMGRVGTYQVAVYYI